MKCTCMTLKRKSFLPAPTHLWHVNGLLWMFTSMRYNLPMQKENGADSAELFLWPCGFTLVTESACNWFDGNRCTNPGTIKKVTAAELMHPDWPCRSISPWRFPVDPCISPSGMLAPSPLLHWCECHPKPGDLHIPVKSALLLGNSLKVKCFTHSRIAMGNVVRFPA